MSLVNEPPRIGLLRRWWRVYREIWFINGASRLGAARLAWRWAKEQERTQEHDCGCSG